MADKRNPILTFLTSNWADKLMAMFLAVVIFWVVDDRITQTEVFPLAITFNAAAERSGPSLLIKLRRDYLGELTDDGILEVTFRGPRKQIQHIKDLATVHGTLTYQKDDIADGETVRLTASQIRFPDIDVGTVRVDAADVTFRVYRAEERSLDVSPVIAADDFAIDDGFQIGEPRPKRQSVNVRYAKKKFNFNTVDLVPDLANLATNRLEPGENTIPFRVHFPSSVERSLLTSDPRPGDIIHVVIPVLAKLQQAEIEVRVDLVLPSDGSITRPVRAEKPRETFTFIGPEATLDRLKNLERSNDEIRARVDLSRLTTTQRKQLEEGRGLSLRPTFVYPTLARDVRCERAKVIWVRYAKEGSE